MLFGVARRSLGFEKKSLEINACVIYFAVIIIFVTYIESFVICLVY